LRVVDDADTHTRVRRKPNYAARRTELLTIRMTMQERGEASTVAERRGISVAELVRRFIKSELEALGASAPARGMRQ
jgi:hypothetical protein